MELHHDVLGLDPWQPGHDGHAVLYTSGDRDLVLAWRTTAGSPFVGNTLGLAEQVAGFDRQAVVATVSLREVPPHELHNLAAWRNPEVLRHGERLMRRVEAADPRIRPLRLAWGAFLADSDAGGPTSVRLLRAEDATALQGVLEAAGWSSDRASALVAHVRETSGWRSVGLIAEVDGAARGAAHIEVDYAWKPEAELRLVVVAPQFRRRGVASALLASAEAFARERGCPAVDAEVWADTETLPIQRFLEAHGYDARARTPAIDLRTSRPVKGAEVVVYRRSFETA